MKKTLRDFFPIILKKDAIQRQIFASKELTSIWNSWNERRQQDFLNWCSGAKGVKVLYDSFFKEVMNPEYAPERLNSLLSTLLRKQIRVLKVLPTDGIRLANEESLVIMDIVVELEDGSLADIEVQRMGYAFLGQRAACYSSDLLLRQYKRVRSEKGEKFLYSDIKPVYVIVLMEDSGKIFHKYPDYYFYHISPKISVNTFTSCKAQEQTPEMCLEPTLELDLLQNYLFLPLDNFKKKYHNKSIRNHLDAWLVFLSMDEPDAIIQLITQYPEFKPLYETIYQMCQNVERMMQMYSKELEILDRNTVRYMIDEMQEEIDGYKNELQSKEFELQKLHRMLEQQMEQNRILQERIQEQ